MSGLAYRIDREGRLTVHDIPKAGLRIGPEPDCVTLEPGQEDANFKPLFAAHNGMAQRIAPHAEFWFGPVVRHPDGESCGGVCIRSSDIAVISSRSSPMYVMRSLFHEAFHAVDTYLFPSARAVLDAAAARGAWYPSDYLRDGVERRARLFESFASYLFEGGELAVLPDTPEVEVMASIYFGFAGQEIMASMTP